MTRLITIGNYKGGVGKSTFTEIYAYLLATKYNKKVLAVDLDPQADLSRKLKKTFSMINKEPNIKLYKALTTNNIKDAILTLHENLDLLHGEWDMEHFEKFIFKTQPDEAEFFYMMPMLEQIKNDYDYILFDTRPSTGVTTKNAICASDYVIITTQTEASSKESAEKIYDYIGTLLPLNPKIKLIGVLPYLTDQTGATHKLIQKELEVAFGDDLFKSYIRASKRVATWGYRGITEHEAHDKKTMKMYIDVVEEATSIIKELEE